MTTLTIQISDKDRDLFERLAKRLNVKILNIIEEEIQPNTITKKAVSDARSRKVKKIESLDSFFKGL
ncbi:MAG: hypothetical protein V4687_01115 [Bacteroidota bacterium]